MEDNGEKQAVPADLDDERVSIDEQGRRIYRHRDLSFTLGGILLTGFILLLQANMFGVIFNIVLGNVKPILLDKAGANSTQIAVILSTIPSIMNFFLVPVISTASDRLRTRWGRRMPFMIPAAPFLMLVLLLIAWHQECAQFLVKNIPLLQGCNVPLILLGVLIVLFQIFWLFPASVASLLPVDILPKYFLGRYYAIASIVSTAVNATYNFLFLQQTVSNFKRYSIVLGSLFLLSYLLMGVFLKEVTYPPPKPAGNGGSGWLSRAKAQLTTFFTECFGHKIYILFILSVGLNYASNICRTMFNVLFATKELHMTMAQYGQVTGTGAIVSIVALSILSRYIDKLNPMYFYFAGGALVIIANIFGYLFVHTAQSFLVVAIATTLMYTIQNIAYMPMYVLIFPREKFGQFTSANSMNIAVFTSVGSFLGGKLTDLFGYRVMFIWDLVITALATIVLLLVYREWKRLGGKNYVSPVSGT